MPTSDQHEPKHESENIIRKSDHALDAKRVHTLLTEFRVVMLGTSEHKRMEFRPMTIAGVDAELITRFVASTDVFGEKDRGATIIAQGALKQLVLHGTLTRSQDRELLRGLWSRPMDAWFHGPDDPKVCALTFVPHEAEIWDVSGLRGLRYLFDVAKAMVTGSTIQDGTNEQHERGPLPH